MQLLRFDLPLVQDTCYYEAFKKRCYSSLEHHTNTPTGNGTSSSTPLRAMCESTVIDWPCRPLLGNVTIYQWISYYAHSRISWNVLLTAQGNCSSSIDNFPQKFIMEIRDANTSNYLVCEQHGRHKNNYGYISAGFTDTNLCMCYNTEGQNKTLRFSFLQTLIRTWGACDSNGGQRHCSRSFWTPAIMFGKVIITVHISVNIIFFVECNTLSWRPLANSFSFPSDGYDNETLQRNIWNLS